MKKIVMMLTAIFIILFVLPLIVVKTAGVNSMVYCLILFFLINPLLFITEGIVFGKWIKQHWYLPLITAIIFLLSAWIVFDMGESAFVLYSVVYFVLGFLSMAVRFVIYSLKKR